MWHSWPGLISKYFGKSFSVFIYFFLFFLETKHAFFKSMQKRFIKGNSITFFSLLSHHNKNHIPCTCHPHNVYFDSSVASNSSYWSFPRPTYQTKGINFTTDFVPVKLSFGPYSFVITLQFRAHVSDGVLYYGADQKTNPSEWFALMLDNGKLSFRMMTSSTSIGELNVSTKKKYDTGLWYQVRILSERWHL